MSLSFFKKFLENPLQIGAITPSSRKLSREIAALVDLKLTGSVIELGPGTGVITRELLNHGVKKEQLWLLEYSQEMATALNQAFSDLHILCGDASEMNQLLPEAASPVSTVVSSLPLLSMSKKKRAKIIEALSLLMPTGTRLIQFTYGWYHSSIFEKEAWLKKTHSKTIVWNLPPARIDVFEVLYSSTSALTSG